MALTKKQRSEIGRALVALREDFSMNGRPRTIPHDPEAQRCNCCDCRKARRGKNPPGRPKADRKAA